MKTVLVFGATGALGSQICQVLEADAYRVLKATRSASSEGQINISQPGWTSQLSAFPRLDGVVWAQGANMGGSVLATSDQELRDMFETNVVFIASTVRQLVDAGALNRPCRTVVLSSIWQDHARNNKFAYLVSKAAVSGLVKSLAIDLAEHGVAVNAVLPGVVDTPMTRANLTSEQLDRVQANSLGGSLVTATDIATATEFLLSDRSAGLNSQFLTVDNGWTVNRHV